MFCNSSNCLKTFTDFKPFSDYVAIYGVKQLSYKYTAVLEVLPTARAIPK